MKRSAELIEKAHREKKGRGARVYLNYLLLSAAFLLCSYLVLKDSFYITDDSTIMNILSGFRASKPSAQVIGIGPSLARIISWLYTAIPVVNWYPWLQIASIWLSLTTILYCAAEDGSAKKSAFSKALFCVIVFSVFLFPSVLTSFTFTSAICGGAVIALAYKLRRNTSTALILAAISLFMWLSINWRKGSGYIVICFAFLMLLLNSAEAFISEKKAFLTQLTALLICVLLVVVNGLVSNAKKKELSEYNSFFDACSQYIDYQHNSYEEAPERYESAGVDPALSELIEYWCYMDTALTKKAFQALSDEKAGTLESVQPAFALGRIYYLSNDSVYSSGLCILCLSLSGAVFLCWRKNRAKLRFNMLGSVFSLGGAVILSLYLSLCGRFLERNLFIIAWSAIVLEIFLVISALEKIAVVGRDRRKLLWKALCAGCIVWSGFCFLMDLSIGLKGEAINSLQDSLGFVISAISSVKSNILYMAVILLNLVILVVLAIKNKRNKRCLVLAATQLLLCVMRLFICAAFNLNVDEFCSSMLFAAALGILAFLGLAFENQCEGSKAKPTSGPIFYAVVFVSAILIVCFSVLSIKPAVETNIEIQRHTEKYVCEHKDNFYLSFYLWSDSKLLCNLSVDKPSNLMFWGDWCMYLPSYYDQLELNGFSDMSLDKLISEKNVYYLGPEFGAELLKNYFTEKNGSCTVSIIEVVNDTNSVYGFTV